MDKAIIPASQQIGQESGKLDKEPIDMYTAAAHWLKTKFDLKSKSEKTRQAYKTTLAEFEMFLQSRGRKLNDNPRQVALLIQEWAILSKQEGKQVSTSTINQRMAILSSYYTYAVRFGACEYNPVNYCERPKRIVEDEAPALEQNYVGRCLANIDPLTREGLRDLAFLTLGFMTGRRLSELTGLQWRHITVVANQVTVKWTHCKGGKVLMNDLDTSTIRVLFDYLSAEYGARLEKITPDSYIFQSHSNRNQHGRLSAAAVSTICLNRLGTSKVHTLRHTYAVNSEIAGASLSEIGDSLGHSNYNTTADYLKSKRKRVYKHIGKLASMYGIDQLAKEG